MYEILTDAIHVLYGDLRQATQLAQWRIQGAFAVGAKSMIIRHSGNLVALACFTTSAMEHATTKVMEYANTGAMVLPNGAMEHARLND